ncbi:MAG: hypothetical protein VX265_17985 [Myxococcota bacterium]|nr:hypothetical protein [Myxococcota bacterium]MEC8425648.1 hypothetical protein [Myxococcota bacterium]
MPTAPAMMLTALLASPALAQGPEPLPAAPTASAATVQRDRPMPMEVNFRGRYMAAPDPIIDIWFFDSDDEGANPFDRPNVRMYALGVEYVLKPRPSNWIFYYEYIGSAIEEGYWDDVEEPAEHDDGDWVKPDGLGMHAVGFNYAHEVDATDAGRDVWLSFLFGAGLGAGLVTGEMTTWHPGGNSSVTSGCGLEDPSYLRKDNCPADDDKRIPRVLPIVDLTASARVNFAERANLRLDMGIHDMLYIGGAVGGVF